LLGARHALRANFKGSIYPSATDGDTAFRYLRCLSKRESYAFHAEPKSSLESAVSAERSCQKVTKTDDGKQGAKGNLGKQRVTRALLKTQSRPCTYTSIGKVLA
jgi:hypothetical protein